MQQQGEDMSSEHGNEGVLAATLIADYWERCTALQHVESCLFLSYFHGIKHLWPVLTAFALKLI